MVRKPVLLLLILTCLLLLAGCDIVQEILSFSPFPGYLAQAVTSVDMRGEIEAYTDGHVPDRYSDVYVLRNVSAPVEEYVFLVIRRDFGGQRIYVLDTDLNLITYDSVGEHNSMNVVDALDDFVFGNITFHSADLSTTLDEPGVFVNWEDQAFSRQGIGNYVVRSYSGMVDCEQFNTSWGSTGTAQTPLGSAFFDMWLRGLGYEPAAGLVYLMFVGHDPDSDEEVLQIVTTPAADYPTLSNPSELFLSYPVSSPVDGVDGESLCYYTRKGVVVPMHNRGRYMLVSLTGDVKKHFWVSHDERPALDFDIDGDYYYIFDEINMRLYKAATGF